MDVSKLPAHKASLSITHNPHLDLYQTVAEYIEDNHNDFVSDEEYEESVMTGELWELRWYPETPVGFCTLMASSLPALLKAAEGA